MGRRLAVLSLALAACGRSWVFDDTAQFVPPPPVCVLAISPDTLDFGQVPPGGSATLEVALTNQGGAACEVSQIAIPADVDGDFFLATDATATLSIPAGGGATIPVTFAPENAAPPLQRTDTLTFQTGDPANPTASVALKGVVETQCRLTWTPSSVDFGTVALGAEATASVSLQNVGSGGCDVTGIAVASGSDPEFSLGAGQPASISLAPGQGGTVALAFTASDPKPPHHRTGTLTLQTGDSQQPVANVPLSANLDVGCELGASPNPLDFGNVILNTTTTDQVTLSNQGTQPCHVTGIAIGTGSDPEFSIPPGQGQAVTVPVGGGGSIGVTFVASDSAPPHLKTGTLTFAVDDPRNPSQSLPLEAFINTACTEAGQWIYTVDENGTFSRFDPTTLAFTDIASPLACPSASTPFSMAVDQNAVAWVEYQDGSLFQVDTTTGACQATAFQPDQEGFLNFGMGFVFQPTAGTDTLYIADDNFGGGIANLGIIAFPSLAVSTVGPLSQGALELTGTGDGELWGFVPQGPQLAADATLLQIDPTDATTLATFEYPSLKTGSANGWAMKFWGGSFWIFIGSGVYQVQRATPDQYTTAIGPGGGRDIVGAGVSTCAPVQ
ncbi:MAG TPA: choice-of-anchor D domain-containing protein [Myxococcales bacterium]|nr:choice-of-anchor D domain-containing protein [Myxococcales bacterium]